MIAEEEPLVMIQANEQRERQGEASNTVVLRSRATQAIVGVASWTRHPLWQSHCLLDVYCHPDFWTGAPALLDALALPGDVPVVVYGDNTCPQKIDVLAQLGFAQQAVLPKWMYADAAETIEVDLIVLRR